MLTLLLGPDDFTKKEYIAEQAKKLGAEVEFFLDKEDLPDLGKLFEQNLFTKNKIMVLEEAADSGLDESFIPKLASTTNHIYLFKNKLDKRSTWGKSLAGDKAVTTKNFPLPHGKDLDKWLIKRTELLGGSLSPAAANELALRLGRDEYTEQKFGGKVTDVTEVFNLWQAEGEIKKLVAFAAGESISPDHVKALVQASREVDIFDILNSLGEGNVKQAFISLSLFYGFDTSSEEKAKTIQLNALLADQFRNILMLQDFAQRRVPEEEILSKTGWKSGRLFVLRKIAGRYPTKKISDTLEKLAALDEELKTTSTPPRVILDMIITQLM
jgi:DNA polymerase III delta subunit